MRLSAIKLAGFKSFVDSSSLPLPSNLTSIVGPNGCGKSNIIDAIRWLLGEQSMRQLRSETMEDVIFNGSKTRKPAGRASVEMLFDNSDGAIAGPYAAYSEISVRRELTRDGESQYYLNGAKCLKRDVTDLFLGTGLGGRSQYAIIEQGMVSNMVQAKPEELRQWIEEAAGISKYKERRRETETRIRQTRENLARLSDLRVELQARLEQLRKQAANAEKYREYKEQERRLKAELLALRWKSLESQCAAQDAAIAELNQTLEEARTRLNAAHDERAAAEAAQHGENQKFNELQGKLYEAESTKSRIEQDLKHAREMKAQRTRELEHVVRQLDEIKQREERESQRLAELGSAIQAAEAEAARAREADEQARAALAAAEQNALGHQQRWDEFLSRSEGQTTQLEAERVRAQQLERSLVQLEERSGILSAEQSKLDAAPIQATLGQADAELKGIQRSLGDAQARLQELERRIQEVRDARSAAEGALHEARQSLQGTRGRFASLETLQAAALRQDDAELNAWLQQHGLHEAPRLGSALQVEQGWERAVEHVLGDLLQAPLVPDFVDKLGTISSAPKSGVNLVHNSAGVATSDHERLSSKVVGPGVVMDLLHGIFVASDAEQAREKVARLGAGDSVITRDGAWLGKDWARYPRTNEKDETGVLARAMLLKQLKVEVDTHTESVRTKEKQVEEMRATAQALESERRDIAATFDDARSREARSLAFRQAQAVRLEQAETRAKQLSLELETVGKTRATQTAELEAARRQVQDLDEIVRQLREERAVLQQSLNEGRTVAQQARTVAQDASAAWNRAQLELGSRRSALESLRGVLHELSAQRASRQREQADHEESLKLLEAPIEEQARASAGAAASVQSAQEALRQAREQLTAAEVRLGAIAQRVQSAEFERDGARERLQAAQIESQGLNVRRQGVSDQITETGIDRDELLSNIKDDATPEAWDEKLLTMARRIERLGAINLAAIQELDEAQARENELGKQNDDIVGALATLEEAMRKIDRETQERFKETFDRVDQIFRDRFPKLFGGGEAYLELTGEDLLETGVRVMARPPGKRNSSIQMLSGGEKTMTAVALLLALFQLNPAPFCLMDEVDAALDDANVARFCEIVREMAQAVQFIIITHNKITMELAHQLHGVTMQEPGVSRLVSVNVQEAVELTENQEARRVA
jgi:chromosome segregation protein